MEKWKAGPDVMKKVQSLIAKYHPHLALVEKEIAVVFREKAIEKSGMVILGNTAKATPLLEVLTDKKFTYRFIIELGADHWNNELDDRQQLALLDHHLCAMKVEEDDKGRKYSLRPPDFVGYKEEIERWGMWRPMDDDTISIIETMFGKKATEESNKAKKRVSSTKPDDIVQSRNLAAGNDIDDVLAALNGSN